MLKKYIITGDLELQTGLHIGGGDGFSAIGAVDKVVIKDPISNLPIIPGSSLKGKIRSLLAREIGSKNPSSDGDAIVRLFGSSSGDSNSNEISRLQFYDCFISNIDELGDAPTEIKFENTIDRVNGRANPRQNERVIRGTKFKFNLVYNAKNDTETQQDIMKIAEGLKLLQFDYLGGHGTRGYGRVSFNNLTINEINNNDSDLLSVLNNILKDVNNYANLFGEIKV